MSNLFVKEEIKVTKSVAMVIDGDGPDCTYMSVRPVPHGISLVIGAKWSDQCCCNLSKNGVAELIAILQDVHSAMED